MLNTMTKRKLFGALVVFAFVFPVSAFGAIDYSRSPSGVEITSPVTLNFSFASTDDLIPHGYLVADTHYKLWIFGEITAPFTWVSSPCYSIADNNVSYVQSLDVGLDIGSVYLEGYPSDTCVGGGSTLLLYLEGDDTVAIFTIISGVVESVGSWLESEFPIILGVGNTMAYTIFSSARVALYVALPFLIGFMIWWFVYAMIRNFIGGTVSIGRDVGGFFRRKK